MRHFETQRISDTMFVTITVGLFLAFILFLYLGSPV